MQVLAVDVGGTKLAAAVVADSGAVTSYATVPTPPGGSAASLWDALAGLLSSVVDGVRVDGVGAACVGPMDWPAGVLDPVNIPGWRGFPFLARLRDWALDNGIDGPVRLHNDAVCTAVGEHWRGAGRGVADMLGMVVSTGIGGGLILGGRLVDGGRGNAGHIGHVVVQPDGRPCNCGGYGCLETVARGAAVVRTAIEYGWTGPEPTARAVAESAAEGDKAALDAFATAGGHIGLVLANAVQLTDLSLVVIGGGLAQAGPLLFDPIRAAYERMLLGRHGGAPPIVPAALGSRAGLVGAAALVLAGDAYWSQV